MNERALVRNAQKGEKQAIEELIRLFYPYVSKFLLKTTRDELLTEDLTQETFLKMIRGIDRYDPDVNAGFGTWIVTIAKNCYIDHLRRNRVEFTDIDEIQLEMPGDISSDVVRRMQYDEILGIVDTLPQEQKVAILMKYGQDMTLAEIAEKFGIPQKTIKSRIHDGTVKIRRILKHREVDGNEQ